MRKRVVRATRRAWGARTWVVVVPHFDGGYRQPDGLYTVKPWVHLHVLVGRPAGEHEGWGGADCHLKRSLPAAAVKPWGPVPGNDPKANIEYAYRVQRGRPDHVRPRPDTLPPSGLSFQVAYVARPEGVARPPGGRRGKPGQGRVGRAEVIV